MYLYKYIYNIYIGGLMEYISKKVAAYGQFVLVFIQTEAFKGKYNKWCHGSAMQTRLLC